MNFEILLILEPVHTCGDGVKDARDNKGVQGVGVV